MDAEDIMWLSCDMAGSHVIDTFLTSSTVKLAKKKELVEKLKVYNAHKLAHVYTLCMCLFNV